MLNEESYFCNMSESGPLVSSFSSNKDGRQHRGSNPPPTNCLAPIFLDHSKNRPLPMKDQPVRLKCSGSIYEWPQQSCTEIPSESFCLQKRPTPAKKREVDTRYIKRSATGAFHRRQGSGDLYIKLPHFENGDVLPRKQYQDEFFRAKMAPKRYVVTAHGSWGDLDDLFSQHMDAGKTSSPTKPFAGKSDSDHELLPIRVLEGIPLPPGIGGGVLGLKEWYKNRTLVSKATSKVEAPPKPKYLRKLVLSSWKHNGAGAAAIINMLNKRPFQSSRVIALKSLLTIHKLMQQGAPECRHACYGRLPLLIDIPKTLNQTGADPYSLLVCAYATMLVEKVTFHQKFPVYEHNYSLDLNEIASQPSCSEAAGQPPQTDALAYLQKVQDMVLIALEEGFDLLQKKNATAGDKVSGTRTMPVCGAEGASGFVSGEPNPVQLVATVLISLLKEADLVYDICWFLLSSQLCILEVGDYHPKIVAVAHKMTRKFGTQHKALRRFFEQAKSEAAITSTVTPPNLPFDPPSPLVHPNRELVRSTLLDHKFDGTRYNLKSAGLLDNLTSTEAEQPRPLSLEGKGSLDVGEDAVNHNLDELLVTNSLQPLVVREVLANQEGGGHVVGGVGAAAAAAMQRFVAGQVEARRAAATSVENATIGRLRNMRLEPPPCTLGLNLQLDSGAFRPQRPQHTRGTGRRWSSFDDEAFLHQHVVGNPWSPTRRLVSPKFYSPRAPRPSQEVTGVLSSRNLESSSPLMVVGTCQINKSASPFDGPPAPTIGMELKPCSLVPLGPFQPEQVREQRAELQGFPSFPILELDNDQLNVGRPETPPFIEMDTPVGECLVLESTCNQACAATHCQSGPPASWQLDGSMSDATAWGDLASCTRDLEITIKTESRMDTPLSADWEIPASELKLGSKIGQGAFGDVLRGIWQGTDVAVKRLQNNFGASYSQAIEEIRHEVAVIMRLRHPNIILFMGACTIPPDICIVMEFAANGSLYGVLHNPNIAIDMVTVVRWASEAARGMNYLHTRNPPVVHRDLKSVNLLVDEDWHIKVSDFGLAMTKQNSYAYTQVGTWGWMAPEVLESAPYNEKADVYSFGVVLWELITRKEPFKGYHPMQIMRAIDRGERPLIPEGCPSLYRQLVSDCWHADPKCRPLFLEILVRLVDISNTLTEHPR